MMMSDMPPDQPPAAAAVLRAEASRGEGAAVRVENLRCSAIPGDRYHYRCVYVLIGPQGGREPRASYFRHLVDGSWGIAESALPGAAPTSHDLVLAERRNWAQGPLLPIFRDTGFRNLRCEPTRSERAYICEYEQTDIGRRNPRRSLLRQQNDGTWQLRRLGAPERQQ